MTQETGLTNELLPCPFCGVIPPEAIDATKILGCYRIVHRCKIMRVVEVESHSREIVVKRWNTRNNPSEYLDDKEAK